MIRPGLLTLMLALCGCARTPAPAQPFETVAPTTRGAPVGPARVWIDTDAACGEGATRDPDDCLALVAFARREDVQIAGLSTTFGNTSRRDVDVVVDQVTGLWRTQFGGEPSRVPGAQRRGDCAGNLAAAAIAAALRDRPLTFVALGPLTNLACVLEADPGLASRIEAIVFVGGARAGHVFHPAEGAPGAVLFGHGPIARDLNVALDPAAARRVLAAPVRLRLTPYDLARQTVITGPDLDRLATSGPMSREVASRSRGWLVTWKTWLGRDGFYPFDLMAAAAVLEPDALVCHETPARVMADRAISGHAFGPMRLILGKVDGQDGKTKVVEVCDHFSRDGNHVASAILGTKT